MKLSDFELEVINILWDKKQTTVPEIHQQIQKSRDVTYSTVKTIVDRMETKGAVIRIKNIGRTIIYTPAIKPEELQKPLIHEFINKVCSGNPRLLINHLLEDENLSKEDLAYLKSIIKEK